MASLLPASDDDDWETDADFENDGKAPAKDESFLWNTMTSATSPGSPWPSKRHSATLSFCSQKSGAVLIGGTAFRHTPADAWILQFKENKPIFEDVTSQISFTRGATLSIWGHSAVAFGSKVLIFGGTALGGDRADLQEIDSETWQMRVLDTDGPSPGARAYHAACAISATEMALFGGRDGDDDLYVFNIPTSTWRRVVVENNLPPPPRREHTLVHYAATDEEGEGHLLLFGGCESKRAAYMNDCWLFDVCTRTWQKVAATGAGIDARGGHASELIDHTLICWGGRGGRNCVYFDDVLFSTSPTTPSWATSRGTGRRPAQGLCYVAHCVFDGRMLVFGGQKDDSGSDESETNVLYSVAV